MTETEASAPGRPAMSADRCESGGCVEVAEYMTGNGPVIRLHSTVTGTTMQCTAAEWRQLCDGIAAGRWADIGFIEAEVLDG